MVTNQAFLFLIFIVNGLTIGLLFDTFRILRISFKTSDIVTYIEDILFWILAGIIVLYSVFVFNNGEIRFYIFLGITLGVLLYITVFSNSIIKAGVTVINFIKKIVLKLNSVLKILIDIAMHLLKSIKQKI